MDDSNGECSTDKDVPDEGEDNDCSNYGGDYTDGQFSTAITKIQIQLNDLISCHKAPEQLSTMTLVIYSMTTCLVPTLANS